MKDTTKIPTKDLEWLETTLNQLVKGDDAELVGLTIIEDLHWSCRTIEDYYEVIDFLKKKPNATRNDIIVLFMDIQDKYPED